MQKVMITILFFTLLLSLWGFYFAIRPIRILSAVTPADFKMAYENISFKTKDNILIHGWFIPSAHAKAKTIILLHGYPADKGNILPFRLFLHSDYNLLFIDFRYLGDSEGAYSTIGRNEVLDLKAAVDYLKTRGINEVGVWGFSLGGAVALMTAVDTPEIKAVVSESSYARLDWMALEYYKIPLLRYPLAWLTRLWGRIFLGYDIKDVSPAEAAKKITIPVLLIHSKNDDMISIKHALLLQEALRDNTKAEVIFVETLHHGEPMEDYQNIVKKFFGKSL
jgi:dipeptidyl aminopeptidase/acylaminoacyl peptidase